MSYSEKGDVITLEMSRADYNQLLIAMGMAAGLASERKFFWHWIDFANRMNTGNPHFIPYEIPEEFRAEQTGGTQIAR